MEITEKHKHNDAGAVLHNRLMSSVKQILGGYYDAVNLICSSLFVDPDFRVDLHGFGWDNGGIPLSCHRFAGGYAGAKEGLGFVLRVDQRYGVRAYHVPRNLLVAEETGTHSAGLGKTGHVLTLIESRENTGHVRVVMRAETHADLSASGFPLQNGIAKTNKEDQSYSLVSLKTQKLLNGHVGNLAVMHPRTVCRLREKDNSCVHVDSTYRNNPGEVMQGVEMIPALQTVTWPSGARDFKDRARKASWPSMELISSITEQGVHLIPDNPSKQSGDGSHDETHGQSGQRLNDKTHDAGQSETKTQGVAKSAQYSSNSNKFPLYDWKYSFAVAERRLFETLNEDTLNIFHALLLINDVLTQFYDIHESFEPELTKISKCVLFWCLEEGIIGQTTYTDDVTKNADDVTIAKVYDVISYLDKKLQSGCLPHYFLDNCNILESCGGGSEFIASLREAVRDLLEYDSNDLVHACALPLYEMQALASDLDEARRQAFYRQVLEKSRDTVEAVFTDMYKLSYMALYSSLHRHTAIDRCMEVHETVQRALTNQVRAHPEPRLLEWTSRLVSNSLANLYAIKALQTSPTKSKRRLSSPSRSPGSERAYCLQKAEELLLISNNIDLISGRVRLANFFLFTNRLQEAWDLLGDVISVTADENEGRESGSEMALDSDIAERIANIEGEEFDRHQIKTALLKPIFSRNCILDLLFSEHEKSILPAVVSESAHMTVGMLLGISKTSIYLLDPEIIVRFLRAITLMKMRENKEFSAKGISDGNGSYTSSPMRHRSEDATDRSERGQTKMTRRSIEDLSDNRDWAKEEAVKELTKLEELCSKEQRDLCEKRNVAYYNMVAACYLQLGLKEEAMRVFGASISIVPNPVRNPAVLKRFSLKNEDTFRKIKGGLGIALAVGLTATIVGVVKSRFT